MSTGLKSDSKLRYFENSDEDYGSKEIQRKMRVDYALEELCGRLNLPDSKKREAVRLFEKVDTQQFDSLVLAGALVHIVSRQEPVMPRWIKLVADECHELSLEENRLMKRYSDLYWAKNLQAGVNRIKGDFVDVKNVTGLDYTEYVYEIFGVNEMVRNFVNRKMYLLVQKPEFQSKSPVGLIGSVLFIGNRRLGSGRITIEQLEDKLCLDKSTFRNYVDMLEDSKEVNM